MAKRSPADLLDNLILDGGWVVVGRVSTTPSSTGGAFSVGYEVESVHTGQRAFLKALDIGRILGSATFGLDALEAALHVYRFERDVCRRCLRMDRVVSIIDAGDVRTDSSDPLTIVPYLIFEQADHDARAFLRSSRDLDIAWSLRSLQHTANGLQQLHRAGIAHQDLKPSNVLVFAQNISKVADLGRACAMGAAGPYDDADVAGAKPYGPPELLYGQAATEFAERRFGCDMYLLGSLLAFYFTGAGMTALLMNNMTADTRPRALHGGWGGDYASVLPVVQSAFSTALAEFERALPAGLRADLVPILIQLCNPDPKRRGNPRVHRRGTGNPYELDYFISRFNNLAARAEARALLPNHAARATA